MTERKGASARLLRMSSEWCPGESREGGRMMEDMCI